MGYMKHDRPLTRNNKKVSLYDALYASYNLKEGKKLMKRQGYYLDKKLSNDNERIFYNPKQNKLLFTIAGTHNYNDWLTDAKLMAGNLKNSNRYKEADEKLKMAKQHYNPLQTSITGHSLGSAIAQGIGKKNDKITTLDGAYTFGQKTKGDAYRSQGDIVSLLGSNTKHMTTLKNKNFIESHKNLLAGSTFGAIGGLIGAGKDILNSHNIENIKDQKIFI